MPDRRPTLTPHTPAPTFALKGSLIFRMEDGRDYPLGDLELPIRLDVSHTPTGPVFRAPEAAIRSAVRTGLQDAAQALKEPDVEPDHGGDAAHSDGGVRLTHTARRGGRTLTQEDAVHHLRDAGVAVTDEALSLYRTAHASGLTPAASARQAGEFIRLRQERQDAEHARIYTAREARP